MFNLHGEAIKYTMSCGFVVLKCPTCWTWQMININNIIWYNNIIFRLKITHLNIFLVIPWNVFFLIRSPSTRVTKVKVTSSETTTRKVSSQTWKVFEYVGFRGSRWLLSYVWLGEEDGTCSHKPSFLQFVGQQRCQVEIWCYYKTVILGERGGTNLDTPHPSILCNADTVSSKSIAPLGLFATFQASNIKIKKNNDFCVCEESTSSHTQMWDGMKFIQYFNLLF